MSLKNQDPQRYSPLHHPGDGYAYDIFSQAGRLARNEEILRGLRAEHVIALGESQSALFLTTYINAVESSGYSGLNATAKSLRDAGMTYNCMELAGTARAECQATLAQPYQQKGLLQDAMKSAAGRLTQINALMDQINATTDQKSVQEIQARIGAENALLAHEVSQVQMLQGMADSEERIARSRERERQYQMLGRTGKVSDYLP